MRLLEKAGVIFDRVNDYLIALVVVLIVFDWLSIVYEVVSRYIFNAPTKWAVELTEYSLLYIAFLSVAWLQRREEHITIDFYKRWNPQAVAIVDIIISVLGVIMTLVLFWYSMKLFLNVFQSGIRNPDSMLGIPQYLILAVIPVGGFLLFIQFLRRTYHYLGSISKQGRKAN